MSFEGTFGNMNINDGLHQLPKDCYPPTESESDGDESFVVLNDPNSSYVGIVETFRSLDDDAVLSSASIDRSLNSLNDLTQSAMNKSASALQSINSLSSNMFDKKDEDKGVVNNGNELNMAQMIIQTFASENAQLKEAVMQNNIAMKDQCEKIVQLQHEYQKTAEQSKSKLQESINKISQLTTERDELIFVRDEQKKVISQLQIDITLLNKSRDDLKASNKALDEISLANVNNFKLEATEKRLNEAIVALKVAVDKGDMLQKKLIIFESTENKLREANIALEEAVEKEKMLQNKLSIMESTDCKLKETSFVLKEAVEKSDMLQSKLNTYEKQSDTLKLRHMDEIARLKEKLYYFHLKQDNYDQSEISQRKMTAQMTEMQRKIVELTTSLNDILTKNVVLSEQLNIYKDDFLEERDARQKLKQEEDQLKCDLEFTRKLNDDLKEENGRLKSANMPNLPQKQDVSSSPPNPCRYECPICSSKFPSVALLQEHVDYCGN